MVEGRAEEDDKCEISQRQEDNFDQQRPGIMGTHTCNLPRLNSLGFPHFSRAVKTALQTHAEFQQEERDCFTIIAL